MKFPGIGKYNAERFLNEAFDPELNSKMTRGILLRRNICVGLFLIGIANVFYTAIIDRMMFCFLFLFFSTTALVIMTKYDTKLFFLRILHTREEKKGSGGNSEES